MAIGGNGTNFIVYTTEEGGLYHAARCTREEFERIRETGRINVAPWSDQIIAEPVYIAFLTVVDDNFDYITEEAREDFIQ